MKTATMTGRAATEGSEEKESEPEKGGEMWGA